MPDDEMPDEVLPAGAPGSHLTERLGGRPGGPPGEVERTERERVRNLIQSVASACNSLVSTETDPVRKAELATRLAFYDAEFRRRATMSAEERAEVLRTYPGLLRRLRTDLGE